MANASKSIVPNSMTSLYFQLTSMDDLEQDLVLMFDNACRYNEPDSQVYKVGFTCACFSAGPVNSYILSHFYR